MDNDGDGIPDGEDNCPDTPNFDQADFEEDGIGDVCDLDIDGDGMPNDYEATSGLDPRNSFDRDADPDLDGFTNLQEYEHGSDPHSPDQDKNNNGIPDTVEQRRQQASEILPAILLLLED